MELTQEYLERKLQELKEFKLIDANLYPSLDLYMDQVTTFMEQHAGVMRRNEEDKILTKTMINNYAKSTLLPAPEKKKYSKEHLMLLMMIFYMKNVLSMSDIQTALTPLIGDSFELRKQEEKEKTIEGIYRKIVEGTESIETDVEEETKKFRDIAAALYPDDQELADLAFLQLCSYDLFLRKALIERIIDDMQNEQKEQKAIEEKAKATAKAEAKEAAREAKQAAKLAAKEAKNSTKKGSQTVNPEASSQTSTDMDSSDQAVSNQTAAN